MELTQKDMKFLTILNETRLSDGKMFGRYSEEVGKLFEFSDAELSTAVRKLVKMGMLSVINAGRDEIVYFHTDKVKQDKLDKSLRVLKH